MPLILNSGAFSSLSFMFSQGTQIFTEDSLQPSPLSRFGSSHSSNLQGSQSRLKLAPSTYYDHYTRNGYYASLAKSGKGNRYRLTLLQRCSALSVTFGFSDSDDTSYHRLIVVCSSWSW